MRLSEIEAIYEQPLFELIHRSHEVHLEYWPKNEVQLCTLLSIKTGGCSEDCSYCSQSSHYSTGVEREQLLELEDVLTAARKAREGGSTRFCMGAAWKGVKPGESKFAHVLDVVRNVRRLGLEVCVTLGNLTPEAAAQLKEAGVTAYNHNLDTSPEFYPEIVSTHTFVDRLQTIQSAQEAGMAICSGGILGMGETVRDRLRMLEVLSQFNPPPESIPINTLMAVPGTPLAGQTPVDVFDLVRMIATTRLVVPRAKVRLSAGRSRLTREGQALCFYAGANSIFYGEKLLTAENPGKDEDHELLASLDLAPQAPFTDETVMSLARSPGLAG